MIRCLEVSYWLTLALSPLAAGFMVRTFIIFHDCGHGSFFKSRVANDVLGAITGILTFTPYFRWRHSHAVHHATSGDLDARGVGDVWTLTVQEYLESSGWRRIGYFGTRWSYSVLAPFLCSRSSNALRMVQQVNENATACIGRTWRF
jgi:omega-6 fatty acid desaturase (delta-12 desaturase)